MFKPFVPHELQRLSGNLHLHLCHLEIQTLQFKPVVMDSFALFRNKSLIPQFCSRQLIIRPAFPGFRPFPIFRPVQPGRLRPYLLFSGNFGKHHLNGTRQIIRFFQPELLCPVIQIGIRFLLVTGEFPMFRADIHRNGFSRLQPGSMNSVRQQSAKANPGTPPPAH